MAVAGKNMFRRIAGVLTAACLAVSPLAAAHADDVGNLRDAFDSTFGTETRAPRTYDSPFEQRIAYLASAEQGRIGVAAVDLATGRSLDILGSQRFPMASTSKIAIAATFLEGVDKGRWSLTSEFPMLIPVRSAAFSTPVAPVREGKYLPAHELIELMLTRSSNAATDALLRVVGGPRAVNAWVRKAGISDFSIDRDIATLVRDDGEVDPATAIDLRDSATPLAMVQLLSGLHRGEWLSDRSRQVLLGAMSRCITGKRRIPALLPEEAMIQHKTGSLNNTSSDVGIVHTLDGRAFAVAIYVTGQGGKLNREQRIASIARALYDGYQTEASGMRRTASR
ncbi:MAG: serine hydrolase [Novosphingobium sp.]|nr:serine hydrolase [Novosphingobium sp.]